MASSAATALAPVPADRRTSHLRAILAARFPEALPLPDQARPSLPTGVATLDGILPNGGLPRGRVSAWSSGSGGATALLRASCDHLLARGERVAWIDGGRTLGPVWADGPTVVRPASDALAIRAAEILTRSGGFALVVLTGVNPEPGEMLRLSRMVHEGQGVLIALSERTQGATLKLRSRFLPSGFQWALGPFGEPARLDRVALEIRATTPGWSRTVILTLEVAAHELRLSLDPTLADRRGQLD
ncbi:MAG: hypothetical protein ACYC2K_17950 [Gemmatimonadales bacterium]